MRIPTGARRSSGSLATFSITRKWKNSLLSVASTNNTKAAEGEERRTKQRSNNSSSSSPMLSSQANAFVNNRKQKIFFRHWIPPSNSYTKAIVFLLHGLGEHSGRYEHVGKLLSDNNYAVFALDHNGHGKSDGEPGYIEAFEDFVEDVTQFIELVNTDIFPNKLPFFILGHSMGGAIAVFAARKQRDNPLFRGAVLSSPAIKKGEDINFVTVLAAKALSRVAPRFGIKAVEPAHVSRDAKVVQAYINDPLVYHGKVTARMGAELLRAIEWIETNPSRVTYPILILQAGGDRIVHPLGAEELYSGAKSVDKEVKVYTGLYHEIFNEPEKWDILEHVIKWMDNRVSPNNERKEKEQEERGATTPRFAPVKAAL